MVQYSHLILNIFILISLTVSTTMQMDLNSTHCHQDFLSGAEFMPGDRISRGINFIRDEQKFVQAKREPRLLSFDTSDQDINIRMEFGVPFITIPTKRTIDGLKSIVYDAMQGQIPTPQLNIQALALIGLLCIGFSGVGILMDQFNFKQYLHGNAPFFFYNYNQRSLEDESNDFGSDTINIWRILEVLDKTLSNYNIDTTACVQHSICVRVQDSIQKLSKSSREASNLDIILEGITRSDWIMRYISGTAIEDAIKTGRNGESCDKVFATCTVNLQFFYTGIQDMMKNVV